MEAVAILDNGYAGAAYEFDQAVWFQRVDQPLDLFPLPGRLEYRIVLADHNGPGAVFTEEPFYLYLFGDLVGRYFIEGQLLPDDLFVGVVISLEDVYLLLELAAE